MPIHCLSSPAWLVEGKNRILFPLCTSSVGIMPFITRLIILLKFEHYRLLTFQRSLQPLSGQLSSACSYFHVGSLKDPEVNAQWHDKMLMTFWQISGPVAWLSSVHCRTSQSLDGAQHILFRQNRIIFCPSGWWPMGKETTNNNYDHWHSISQNGSDFWLF
jgi:hypothetical protein